jgi:hypothetical protein
LIVPATTTPGIVRYRDSSGGAWVTVFNGGTVSDLKPFYVPVGQMSELGDFQVNTGANVAVVAYGDFTV